MKKLFSLLSIIALISFTACSEDEFSVFGSVHGIVSDAKTGEPVRNATVILSPGNFSTVTGRDGHYEFTDLEAGSYKVQCSASEYETNSRQVSVYAGGNISCDIALSKIGAISGISLSTNALEFDNTSSEEVFSITNTGNSGTISWSISNISASWLTVTPTSGSVAQGKSSTVTVRIDRSKISKDETTYITINAAGGSMSVAVYVECGSAGNGNGNGNGEQGKSEINFNTTTLDFGTSKNELILEVINMTKATANLHWKIDSYPDCLSIPFTSGELEPGYYHELKITLNRSAMTSDLDDSIIIRDLDDNEYYRITVKATNVVEEDYSSAKINIDTDDFSFKITKCKRSGNVVKMEYLLTNNTYDDTLWSIGSGYASDDQFNSYDWGSLLYTLSSRSGNYGTSLLGAPVAPNQTVKGSISVKGVDPSAKEISFYLKKVCVKVDNKDEYYDISMINIPIY